MVFPPQGSHNPRQCFSSLHLFKYWNTTDRILDTDLSEWLKERKYIHNAHSILSIETYCDTANMAAFLSCLFMWRPGVDDSSLVYWRLR
jgi:hypothetical protein